MTARAWPHADAAGIPIAHEWVGDAQRCWLTLCDACLIPSFHAILWRRDGFKLTSEKHVVLTNAPHTIADPPPGTPFDHPFLFLCKYPFGGSPPTWVIITMAPEAFEKLKEQAT